MRELFGKRERLLAPSESLVRIPEIPEDKG
jgi:hypothetical protein